MPRTVTVGLDGSAESRAAVEWAAREAKLLGLPLRLLHVWQPLTQAPLLGAETEQDWTEQLFREVADGLRVRHTGVEVVTEHAAGRPVEVLCQAAREAELLVLGSRALGGVGGFVVGSVGLSVVAHAERPVVLVRAGEQAADEHESVPAAGPSGASAFRPVVLGLDTSSPDEDLIRFAFDAAVRRATSLRVVHGWHPPAYFGRSMAADAELHASTGAGEATALSRVLRDWRHKYADVAVTEDARSGSAAQLLVEASRTASLVVLGRRVRRRLFGTHIGHVAHAVLHHGVAPVAIVAHD
ncbi:universal stress protein [Streptomyces sp. NPDC015220]|uniref:universal stress protein n=1 Tax=Streptomyces sp. NPDC015220 TaxID=3364947 RepID=UPI0036F785B8